MKKFMSLKKRTLALILAAMAVMGGSAYAAEAEKEFSLDPVLVTATRYETRDVDIPAATEVFTEEDFNRVGATNVMDVVRNIPGFTLTASPTGNQYVGFRGLARNYVAIMVNGVPLHQDGNYDLESFSTDMVEKIEVVKGGSSVLYGSNASAGVINIITKKPQNLKNKIVLGGGDKHKLKGAINLAGDKFLVNVSRNQARDKGRIYKSNATDYYVLDRQTKDSYNVQFNANDHLNFEYLHTVKTSDCSKSLKGVRAPGFHSTVRYDMAQAHYTNNDLSATMFYRNRDWKYNDSTHQQGRNFGLDINDKFDLGKVNLTVGANYERERTQNYTNVGPGKRDMGALFFMTETALSDKTKLFVGAREAYVEESGYEFCPQFQVLQSVGKDSNVYVNVNKSMRAPNVYEQWGTATQLMNPDLKAETGWNYELGWKTKLSDSEMLKFDLFYMQIDDRIYSVRNYNGSGKSIYLNADKYRNKGIDISYDKKLSQKFNYNLGIYYANPEQKTGGKDWERTDFKLGVNAGLGYALANTSAHVTLNYMGARVNDCRHMFDMNLNLKHNLSKATSLNLNVYNLLDREDLRTGSSNGTSGSMLEGRNWLFTVEHKF